MSDSEVQSANVPDENVTSAGSTTLYSDAHPENAPCTKERSLLWLAVANLCFVGGALLFGWFQGVPVWGGLLLIFGLELGLGLMWFGDRFVLKMDTAQLNQALQRYQKHDSV